MRPSQVISEPQQLAFPGNRASAGRARRRLAHLLGGNGQLRHVLSLQFTHKPLIAFPIHGTASAACLRPTPEGPRLPASADRPRPRPKALIKADAPKGEKLPASLPPKRPPRPYPCSGRQTPLKMFFSPTSLRSVPPGKGRGGGEFVFQRVEPYIKGGKGVCVCVGGGEKVFSWRKSLTSCRKTRLLYTLRSLSGQADLVQIQY